MPRACDRPPAVIFALVLNTGSSQTAILVDEYAITALGADGMTPVPVRSRRNALSVVTVDGVDHIQVAEKGMLVAYGLDGSKRSTRAGPPLDFDDPWVRVDLDVDGDGELEQLGPVADGLRWIDGDDVRFAPGAWTQDQNVAWNARDYDGDGRPELVMFRAGVPLVRILEADTGDALEQELPTPPGASAWPGDIDGDGDLDLWIPASEDRGVIEGINEGGRFTWTARAWCEPVESVALADLDGDGRAEKLAVADGRVTVDVEPDCAIAPASRTVGRVSGDGRTCAVTGPGRATFVVTPRREALLDLEGEVQVLALSMDGSDRLEKHGDTLVWQRGGQTHPLGEGWQLPVMGDGWVAYRRDGCVQVFDGTERCVVNDKTVRPLGGDATLWVRDGRQEIELALDGAELGRGEAGPRWEHAFHEDQRAWFERDGAWILVTSDGDRIATDRAPLRYDRRGRLHVGDLRLDGGALVQDVPRCAR